MDDLNNRAFIDKLRRGDTRAFQILFDRLLPKLCNFLTTHFDLRPHDAEEIASDAMLKVHKSVERFDQDGGAKLTTWIFEIARNATIDHLRRRAAQKKKAAGAAAPDEKQQDAGAADEPRKKTEDYYEMVRQEEGTEDSLSMSTQMYRMRRAFDSISEQDRDILRMRRVMEYDEIAKVENISTNYARVRHARAEERLRAAYEKEKKDER